MIVGERITLPQVHTWQVYLAKQPNFLGLQKGDKINFDDYELVAKIDGKYPPFQVAQNIEDAWIDNDTTLEVYGDNQNGCRSLSVSDIVCNTITGQCYIVNNIGYHLLESGDSKSAEVDNNDRFLVDITCSWCGKPYDGTEVLDEYEGQIVHYRCAASDNYKAESSKNHIWINNNPERYSFYRCGCGKKLRYVDHKGCFECFDCGANWDGKKYLGLDEVWNWCKNCGMSFVEWDGEKSCTTKMDAETFEAQEYGNNCYDCGGFLKDCIGYVNGEPCNQAGIGTRLCSKCGDGPRCDSCRKIYDYYGGSDPTCEVCYQMVPYNPISNVGESHKRWCKWDAGAGQTAGTCETCWSEPWMWSNDLGYIFFDEDSPYNNSDYERMCLHCMEEDFPEIYEHLVNQPVKVEPTSKKRWQFWKSESFEADYYYGLGDYYEEDPDLWEHRDKYKIRHRVRDAILKMPTDKAWEYIIWIDSQDGAISEEENEAWETALANKDLEAALQNLIIERGYINEGWGTGIINELKDHNYYQAEDFEATSYGNYYGACLLPDGSCTETSLDMCRALGGRFQGPGTSCYPDDNYLKPRIMRSESSNQLGKGFLITVVAGAVSGLVAAVFGTVISEIILDRLREDPELEITDENPETNTP